MTAHFRSFASCEGARKGGRGWPAEVGNGAEHRHSHTKEQEDRSSREYYKNRRRSAPRGPRSLPSGHVHRLSKVKRLLLRQCCRMSVGSTGRSSLHQNDEPRQVIASVAAAPPLRRRPLAPPAGAATSTTSAAGSAASDSDSGAAAAAAATEPRLRFSPTEGMADGGSDTAAEATSAAAAARLRGRLAAFAAGAGAGEAAAGAGRLGASAAAAGAAAAAAAAGRCFCSDLRGALRGAQ